MSGTAADIGEATVPKDDSYGPDRTLVQMADWLTENAKLFEAVFESVPSLALLRIKQSEFEEGYEVISSHPVYTYRFEDGTELDDDKMRQTVPLRGLKLLVGARGEGISQNCVLDRRPYFREVFTLTLNRSGACQCDVRYHAFGRDEISIHEMIEQCFEWRQGDDRYSGVEIELKLWSRYIPAFVKGPKESIQTLQMNPALIQTHDETVHFRDEGFRPLFLMRRPPDRIELEGDHISVIYVGENKELRIPGVGGKGM